MDKELGVAEFQNIKFALGMHFEVGLEVGQTYGVTVSRVSVRE